MNTFAIVFLAAVACASAGFIPASKSLQGPSSKTTVVGPDGSSISAFAPGGQIVHGESAGVVAHSAPVLAAAPVVASYAAPAAAAYAAPAIHAAPIAVAHAAPVAYAAHAAPVAYAAHAAPVAYAAHAAPVAVAHAAPVVAHSALTAAW